MMGTERTEWAQEINRKKSDVVGGHEETREKELSGMTSEFMVCATVWMMKSFTETGIHGGGHGPREEEE